MVNTGHPSRACKLCRSRRIRCDETKPHCLKCKKSKRQCPGYRDPFEINLRDETQATIRKAKAAAAATHKRVVRNEDQDASSDESLPTPIHTPPRRTSIATSRGQSSPQASETSWDVVSKSTSTWSSPSSEVSVLQRTSITTTTTVSPPNDAFESMVFDFNLPPSTQDFSFDLNTEWSLPETWLSSSNPIDGIAKSIMSSSFDGMTWGHSSTPSSPDTWAFSPPVLPGLQTPLDEQAACFFLSNFVLTLTSGQNCLFSFVLKILQWDGIQDTPFPMAFAAVSLAALAGRPNSRHLLQTSRVYYSTALLQLKEVLKDKDQAKHDTSLAAAILLSFYEVGPDIDTPTLSFFLPSLTLLLYILSYLRAYE